MMPLYSATSTKLRSHCALLVCLSIFSILLIGREFNGGIILESGRSFGNYPKVKDQLHWKIGQSFKRHQQDVGGNNQNLASHCFQPSLPNGNIHIVVAMANYSESSAALVWVNKLGYSNADLFLYYRRDRDEGLSDQIINDNILRSKIGCNVTVHFQQIIPNKGFEVAVYLHHIIKHYQRLPEVTLFAHYHGPHAWHASNDMGVYERRTDAYYKAILNEVTPSSSKFNQSTSILMQQRHISHKLQKFVSNVVSLSSCYDQPGWHRSPFCIKEPYVHDSRSDESWIKTYALFDEILATHGNNSARPGNFFSCCASFLARASQIRVQPFDFYEEGMKALLNTDIDSYYTSRWWEFIWYRLWDSEYVTEDDVQIYLDIDGQCF